MKEIYDQEMELKGQRKLVRQLHEESRLKNLRLCNVPNLEAEINSHGFGWLSQKLGKYASYIVREFNASYHATIRRDLAKNKKAIE